jgi:serine/threonine protein kinase
VWSLGVILYQLISGRMPFIADTLPALCLAVINEEPPSLESVRKDLPHGLADVVMKCLAKKRDERYMNVHQLAQGLAPFARPEALGAVTRIRSMLQRKRPPTPPPLMMLPSEFSDVAPTLIGSSDSLDIQVGTDGRVATPVPKMPSGATRTTMGGATGESMSLLNQTRRPGVIGALLGGIALVGLIIVMVLIKKGSGATAATVDSLPPAAAPKQDKTDKVEKTDPPPPAAGSQVKVDPIDQHTDTPSLTVVETPVAIDPGAGSAKKPKNPKDPKKDPKVKDPTKDPKDPKDPKNAGSGSAVPPPDGEDDKWSHMQHDGDKKDEPEQPKE